MAIIYRVVVWNVFSVISLLLSIWLAWHVSASLNFLYPTWYEVLDINNTVQQVIPRHLYKKDFIDTDAFEHQRLFGEIVTSIQNHGQGLDDITYYDTEGEPLGKLLTDNEIVHLMDVSNLVNNLNKLCFVLLIFYCLLLGLIIINKLTMPSLNRVIAGVLIFILVVALAIIAYGATEFFYWLHTIVFPENHQWFFYYEESLMSTIMKAPDLFAPISIQLLVLGIFIWLTQLLLVSGLSRLVSRSLK